ncbi:hypothetical protein Tco_1080291 [Tanacetum coccineum]|uniref:Uncharacterized protein n=1 Tax=Tanacetum coccineum TaxID=301880 RepID=A0ABQ5HUA8_9ASTR
MLIFKLQRHTFGIKSSSNQESLKHTKIKTFLDIQKTIGTSREIVSFQDDTKYEHVGLKHKGDSRMFKKESTGLHQTTTKVPVTSIKFIHNKERFRDLGSKDKGSRSKITKHEETKSTTTKLKVKIKTTRA